MKNATEERFVRLWTRIFPEPNEAWDILRARNIFKKLAEKYSEPHRAYHTLEHIDYALGELDESTHDSPEVIELALWFHDLIYDPRSPTNEIESAHTFLVWVNEAGHNIDDLVTNVARMIGNTTHKELVTDWPSQLLCDIDVAGLGRSFEEYMAYGEKIRFEYNFVPVHVFNAGRIAFIEGMLAKRHIYYTDFFRERYEAQAQANLKEELRLLNTVNN